MEEFPYFRASVARKVKAKAPGSAFPPEDGAKAETGKYCAYNQDRQRFLCANVEAEDFSATRLDARLFGITPRSGAGLWIAPLQPISPTSVRVPLDLIYLDCNSVVLDAVESFPIFQTTLSIASATSILALPAETIGSTGTQPGDRLLLCGAEEMKLRLQQISDPIAETRSERGPACSQSIPSVDCRLNHGAVGNLLPWMDRSDQTVSGEIAPTASAPANTASTVQAPEVPAPATPPLPEIVPIGPAPADAAPPDLIPAPRWRATTSKSWLQRLLSSEPSDPRKAPRSALPWLVAYFFTGGRPVAHGIRDISATGVYVFTEDRWYPGTVIRITLTDKRNPSSERSLTINAKVVRSAEDGVGFQFVLKDEKDSRNASASGVDSQVQGVYRRETEEFLLRMSSGAE